MQNNIYHLLNKKHQRLITPTFRKWITKNFNSGPQWCFELCWIFFDSV